MSEEFKGELTGQEMYYVSGEDITKVHVGNLDDYPPTLLEKYLVSASDGSWSYPKTAYPSSLFKNFKDAVNDAMRFKKYERIADEQWYERFINKYKNSQSFRDWFDQRFEADGGSKINGWVADKVMNLMVDAGQHDPKFKLGETIRYSPSEVHDILWDYIVAEDT